MINFILWVFYHQKKKKKNSMTQPVGLSGNGGGVISLQLFPTFQSRSVLHVTLRLSADSHSAAAPFQICFLTCH